jgi:DNA-binding NarL/FixJ family response regulator
MNGFQFINLLTELFPEIYNNTKIVMLTSSDDPQDVKQAEPYENIIVYCEKPISVEKFTDVVVNKIRSAVIFHGQRG